MNKYCVVGDSGEIIDITPISGGEVAEKPYIRFIPEGISCAGRTEEEGYQLVEQIVTKHLWCTKTIERVGMGEWLFTCPVDLRWRPPVDE